MITKVFSRLLFSAILLSSILLISCDDDDSLDSSVIPEFSDFPTSISSAPGLEFIFEGTINDEHGIESVNISYSNWFLDKTIDYDNTPNEYNLKYKFLVPEDEEPNSAHTLKVSATNIVGNIITYDVVVTLDFDVTNPEIEFISPESGSSFTNGDTVELNINFTDDKALDSIYVSSELLNIDIKMKMPENTTAYNYLSSIDIPDSGIEGAVLFDVIAVDKTGNRNTSSSTIIVGELDEIHEVYAVGGSMWWEWDVSKASRMWKNPNDEDWFVLEFYYWTDYGIKFTGQLDWEPNNWGTDPNDTSKLINSQDSGTIEFPDGDGYYHVEFNPYTLEYTYEKMTVDVEVKSNMYLMGSGFVGYPLNWDPADAIPMDKDPWENPYVFTAWVEISDETSLKFIGQTDGWGPYDCGFEIGGEKTFPVNYVKNFAGDGSADIKFNGQAGWYYITFDYFLLRTTIHEYN